MALEYLMIPGRIKADNVVFRKKSEQSEQSKSALSENSKDFSNIMTEYLNAKKELSDLNNNNSKIDDIRKKMEANDAKRNASDIDEQTLDELNKEHDALEKQYYELASMNFDQQILDKQIEIDSIKSRLDTNAIENEQLQQENATNSCQNFSYRKSDGEILLQIVPSFLCNDSCGQPFNDDIGNTALYGFAGKSLDTTSTVTFNDVMEEIPGVKIREYQVDYMLVQVINLMQTFAEEFQKGYDFATSNGTSTEGVGEKAKQALQKSKDIFKKIWTNISDGSLTQAFINALKKYGLDSKNNGLGGRTDDTSLMAIPYVFYNTLLSYTTTNFYTVPFNGKKLYSTNGSAGWTPDKFSFGKTIADKLGPLAGIANTIGGSFLDGITISKNPKFQYEGVQSSGDTYEIKFSLFNNTKVAAINNFLFIHNLIPNNMWLQYGLLVHSPALYDVKIDGGIRSMCCTGNFNIDCIGNLRSVPKDFLTELKKYSTDFDVVGAGNTQKLIKIPDVYDVSLTFSSLLPTNFNTYLLGFSNPNYTLGHFETTYNDVIKDTATAVKSLLS